MLPGCSVLSLLVAAVFLPTAGSVGTACNSRSAPALRRPRLKPTPQLRLALLEGGSTALASLDLGSIALVGKTYSGQLSELREEWTELQQSIPDLIPRLPSLFGSNLLGSFSDVRENVNATLVQFRAFAIILTFAVFLCALLVGRVAGDPIAAGDDRDRKRKLVGGAPLGDDFVFLATMDPTQAVEWDRGVSPQIATRPRPVDALEGDARRQGLSQGVWLELFICLALDVAGCASYFYPTGEVSDVAFAFVSAFTIELLFGWPELALIGFWEEILPLTDVLPTATIGWILVVLGYANDNSGRSAKRVVRRPPLGDQRSFAKPDPHLRPGNREWL